MEPYESEHHYAEIIKKKIHLRASEGQSYPAEGQNQLQTLCERGTWEKNLLKNKCLSEGYDSSYLLNSNKEPPACYKHYQHANGQRHPFQGVLKANLNLYTDKK